MQKISNYPHRQNPVTAVIPAYNEANHIGSLLDVLFQVRTLTQIIVVDDGSTDDTQDVVRSFCKRDARIQLVCLSDNQGKGGAVLAGAQVSKNDLIVFLDADLIELHPENVLALIEPVSNGKCSITLGIYTQGHLQTDLTHWLTPFLSGQRCLRWSRFQSTPDLALSRWGVEAALSLHAWQYQHKSLAVPWRSVTHVMRPEKMTGIEGYWSHVQMWLDIVRYLAKCLIGGRRRHMRWMHSLRTSL